VFSGHLVRLLCSCAWRGFSVREAVQTARGRNYEEQQQSGNVGWVFWVDGFIVISWS
jgi:hypothetical protein